MQGIVRPVRGEIVNALETSVTIRQPGGSLATLELHRLGPDDVRTARIAQEVMRHSLIHARYVCGDFDFKNKGRRATLSHSGGLEEAIIVREGSGNAAALRSGTAREGALYWAGNGSAWAPNSVKPTVRCYALSLAEAVGVWEKEGLQGGPKTVEEALALIGLTHGTSDGGTADQPASPALSAPPPAPAAPRAPEMPRGDPLLRLPGGNRGSDTGTGTTVSTQAPPLPAAAPRSSTAGASMPRAAPTSPVLKTREEVLLSWRPEGREAPFVGAFRRLNGGIVEVKRYDSGLRDFVLLDSQEPRYQNRVLLANELQKVHGSMTEFEIQETTVAEDSLVTTITAAVLNPRHDSEKGSLIKIYLTYHDFNPPLKKGDRYQLDLYHMPRPPGVPYRDYLCDPLLAAAAWQDSMEDSGGSLDETKSLIRKTILTPISPSQAPPPEARLAANEMAPSPARTERRPAAGASVPAQTPPVSRASSTPGSASGVHRPPLPPLTSFMAPEAGPIDLKSLPEFPRPALKGRRWEMLNGGAPFHGDLIDFTETGVSVRRDDSGAVIGLEFRHLNKADDLYIAMWIRVSSYLRPMNPVEVVLSKRSSHESTVIMALDMSPRFKEEGGAVIRIYDIRDKPMREPAEGEKFRISLYPCPDSEDGIRTYASRADVATYHWLEHGVQQGLNISDLIALVEANEKVSITPLFRFDVDGKLIARPLSSPEARGSAMAMPTVTGGTAPLPVPTPTPGSRPAAMPAAGGDLAVRTAPGPGAGATDVSTAASSSPAVMPGDVEDEPLVSVATGFAVTTQGHLLTMATSDMTKCSIWVTVRGKQLKAKVVASDESHALALLKVDAETRPLYLERDVTPDLGDAVMTAGFPNPEVQGTSVKVTKGHITSLRGLGDDMSCYQCDAVVQPGSNGGPLLDARRRVVGMVLLPMNQLADFMDQGAAADGIALAMKADYMMPLLRLDRETLKGLATEPPPDGERLADLLKDSTFSITIEHPY